MPAASGIPIDPEFPVPGHFRLRRRPRLPGPVYWATNPPSTGTSIPVM